jgi:hypothetical protein
VPVDVGASVDKYVSTIQNLLDEYKLGSKEADDKIRAREHVFYLLNGVPEGSMLKVRDGKARSWTRSRQVPDTSGTWFTGSDGTKESLPPSRIDEGMIDNWNVTSNFPRLDVRDTKGSGHDSPIPPIRVAQTAFILFSTFLDLRPVSDASD